MKKIFGISSVICLVGVLSSIFIVNQIEQVVITRFGEPVRVIKDPGLYFKIPFMESVVSFDKRMMSLELSALEVTLGDKRRLIVDAFGRYVIDNPLKFYQTVYNEYGVLQRLNPVFLGGLSSVLGNLSLPDLLSEKRSEAMKQIKNEINKSATRFGIKIVDVRITKTDLPPQNSEAISQRMISERQREAKELRAKGVEKAKEITSQADRDNKVALAEADKKAQILIGEGEKEANKIYAENFSKSSEFFKLFRRINTINKSFTPDTTTYILNKDENLFKIMD